MHEVRRGEGVEEHLLVVPRGVGRIDPVAIPEDEPLGFGVPALQDRVARPFGRYGGFLAGLREGLRGCAGLEDDGQEQERRYARPAQGRNPYAEAILPEEAPFPERFEAEEHPVRFPAPGAEQAMEGSGGVDHARAGQAVTRGRGGGRYGCSPRASKPLYFCYGNKKTHLKRGSIWGSIGPVISICPKSGWLGLIR